MSSLNDLHFDVEQPGSHAANGNDLPIHSLDVAGSLDEAVVVENDVKNQQKLEQQKKKTDVLSTIVFVVLIATFVLHVLSMWISQSVLAYIAGLSSVAVAVTASIKQYMLQRMDTLRCVHNKIRMEVNRLMLENNVLHRNVDALEIEVARVEEVEKQLAGIAEAQNSSTNELLDLVRVNGETIKRQKELARAAFQEQILTTVLRSDRDSDLKITDREVNILISRMKSYDGVRFDEDNIRNSLQSAGGSIWKLMELLREVTDEDDESANDGVLNGDLKPMKSAIMIRPQTMVDSHRNLEQ